MWHGTTISRSNAPGRPFEQQKMHIVSLFLSLSAFFFLYATASPALQVPTPVSLAKRAARTSPPAGAVVVRGSGTYHEKVLITRAGPLTIYGSTADTSSYTSNTVTITFSDSAAAEGSDDPSGTLRVKKDNFAMYNVNVKNTFGVGSQALALSAYGTNQAYYGCGFYGYQDTLLTETGNQFYGVCYIEGTVDFIWGQHARTWIQRSVIASTAAGSITADGPSSASDNSICAFYRYLLIFSCLFGQSNDFNTLTVVINCSNIIQSSAATTSLTGKVYLGRPWTQWARVVYTSCTLGAQINSAGWSVWSSSTPNTRECLVC
ncbi:Carbohydrate esterase family 8 protein [Mycena indigotica]|uniref:pectinesterase n=1 Tax=Mycena indigotica TaxID=2126181 RepID=A0A8H6S6E8_9AGAR|nr:Carbohydrate esterase family 8 protein [Mycena indigotica]KAF7292662.1 Carbohydrate esterase family 8 protein [Mycena indigotica]